MSSDLNEIFGYQVYKPPPEEDLPVIADLNCHGEIVTLLDSNADVIKDPVIQNIFKNLDGERTVKIEDLPPDIRYDGWNRKAQYDKQVISKNMGKPNVLPQQPILNQVSLKGNENNEEHQINAIRQAQMRAQQVKQNDQQFVKQLQQTRMALEKEIHRQLVEQLTIRAQNKSATPEQQALIEKLYLDLRLINPELAFATLKASAQVEGVDPNALHQPLLRTSEPHQQHVTKMTAQVVVPQQREHIQREHKHTSERRHHTDHHSSSSSTKKPSSSSSKSSSTKTKTSSRK